MMKKIKGLSIFFLLFCFLGCTPMPAKNWTSCPVVQSAVNKYFEAQLEPLKKDDNFFVLLRLAVKNKTDKDLEIDWNKTRYVHNGKPRGGFVFQGANPEDIKNQTIPPDIVPAWQTLSKEIAPFKLIAGAPFKYRSVGVNESGFSPGVIPEGENGIFLIVRSNGQEVREKITLIIETKEVQP